MIRLKCVVAFLIVIKHKPSYLWHQLHPAFGSLFVYAFETSKKPIITTTSWRLYLDNVSLSNTSPGGHPDLISIQLFHSCYINRKYYITSCFTIFALSAKKYIISPSNSAGPTPTIMMDMGRDAACKRVCKTRSLKIKYYFERKMGLTVTTASRVCTMSEMTPSVMISNTKYCEPSVTSAAHLNIYNIHNTLFRLKGIVNPKWSNVGSRVSSYRSWHGRFEYAHMQITQMRFERYWSEKDFHWIMTLNNISE